jgi:hypothetical protein
MAQTPPRHTKRRLNFPPESPCKEIDAEGYGTEPCTPSPAKPLRTYKYRPQEIWIMLTALSDMTSDIGNPGMEALILRYRDLRQQYIMAMADRGFEEHRAAAMISLVYEHEKHPMVRQTFLTLIGASHEEMHPPLPTFHIKN